MAGRGVAVDIGGTFTDLVAASSDGELTTAKALTTPGHLATGVLEVLDRAVESGSEVEFFVHGTTAGLNALLERRYAPIGLLTTKGFRDVYEIGRANRPAMYDLHYHRPPPLVPRRYRLEVVERMSADGHPLTPIDVDSVREAIDQLVAAGIASVAVVFLHSYRNPAHELQCEQIIAERHPEISVSLSHRIANEWREYERTSTTAVNAAIAPTVRTYLSELEDELRRRGVAASVHIMQSNGGMTTAARAREQPVNTLLSGPVGGAIAAANHPHRRRGRTTPFPDCRVHAVGVFLSRRHHRTESAMGDCLGTGRPVVGDGAYCRAGYQSESRRWRCCAGDRD